MVAERVVVADGVMDAAAGVCVSKTGSDTGNNEENLNEGTVEIPPVQFMDRISGETAVQIPQLQKIGMVVDFRGEQETQKQFVEDGVETGEGTLEELKTLIKVSREWHALVMEALDSLDAMAAGGLGVQNSDLEVALSRFFIPSSDLGRCRTGTRKTRSSVSSNFERSH